MERITQAALVIVDDADLGERLVGALGRADLRGHVVADPDEIDDAGGLTAALILVDAAAANGDVAAVRQRWPAGPGGTPELVALIESPSEADPAFDAGATDAWLRSATPAELDVRLAAFGRQLAQRRSMHLVLENVPSFVMLLDRLGGIRLVNQGGPGAGGPRLGRPAIEQILPEHRGRVIEAFQRAARTGQVQSCEAQSVFGMIYQCRVIPSMVGGRFDGAAVVATDVTEQRWTEAEQRTLASKATAILQALPDIMFWLRRDGEFLDFYAGDESLLVVPPDRIVGSRLQDVLPASLSASMLETIELALATRSIQLFEYQLPIRDRTIDFEARIMASGDDEVVCVVRDVTERSRMQAQLAISDRLAALGTLAAGVAHEINNPLTYILIGVESVTKELRKLPADRPLGERGGVLVGRLEGALEGARRVRRIVADLKAFSRADDDDRGPVDVRAILDGVAALVDSQVRYRGRLVKEYGEVPRVRAGGDRLNQVFLNLLINAAQALPEGRAPDNEIRLVVSRDERGRVVAEVRDTGHGIGPEDLGRIFDPFFTTKPIGIGTGLGLWICHSIVTNLGGDIAVESQLGKGTTFRVSLPAADAVEPAVGEVTADDEVAWRSGRILIVDDEDRVASAVGLLFEGCEVITAASGRAALIELGRGAPFDWIFCDLMMPDVSGMDVYDQVRREQPGIQERMIFMTGGAFTPRAREFLASIDNPVLHKPFRLRDLTELLRQRAHSLRARG
jgi:signal transduction histidine kinase/DNA-binding response OmpR family regulator